MLVTIKTLQQESFTIEVDPSQNVKSIKEKIEQMKGKDFSSKHQKLMYAGKILADNKSLEDYNIDEKKYLIILVKKPKVALVRDSENDDIDDSQSDQAEAEANGPIRGTEAVFVSDAQQQEIISQLMEMGYNRPDVEQALRASFYNPDRAVEYLVNGIMNSSAVDDSSSAAEGSSDSSVVRACVIPPYDEELNFMQQALRTSTNHSGSSEPNETERPVLSSSHRQAVYQLLSDQQSSRDADANEQSSNSVLMRARTPQDQEAIERLRQLGFPEYQVIEAYFACEKNENSAADFLFSQNYD